VHVKPCGTCHKLITHILTDPREMSIIVTTQSFIFYTIVHTFSPPANNTLFNEVKTQFPWFKQMA